LSITDALELLGLPPLWHGVVSSEIDMEGKLDRKASALISQALNHVIASAQNIGSADTRGSDVQESTGA